MVVVVGHLGPLRGFLKHLLTSDPTWSIPLSANSSKDNNAERNAIVAKVFCRCRCGVPDAGSRRRLRLTLHDWIDSDEVNSTSEITSTLPQREMLLLRRGVARWQVISLIYHFSILLTICQNVELFFLFLLHWGPVGNAKAKALSVHHFFCVFTVCPW